MIAFNNIASVTAFLVSVTAIVAFLVSRKKAAIEEGKQLKEVEQLRADLDRAHEKIRDLTIKVHAGDVSLASIGTDVKNLLEATKRIEAKLDGHIVAGVPG